MVCSRHANRKSFPGIFCANPLGLEAAAIRTTAEIGLRFRTVKHPVRFLDAYERYWFYCCLYGDRGANEYGHGYMATRINDKNTLVSH